MFHRDLDRLLDLLELAMAEFEERGETANAERVRVASRTIAIWIERTH